MKAIIFFFFLSVSCFAQCDGTLWKYVYHPCRFIVYDSCRTVTGTIKNLKKEPDGDWHIRLKLDAGQEQMLNAKNIARQHGCLVAEVVCANPITQSDAKKPCEGCPKNIKVPKRGTHGKVTGTFVNDKPHGWNEIHPVYELREK